MGDNLQALNNVFSSGRFFLLTTRQWMSDREERGQEKWTDNFGTTPVDSGYSLIVT